MNRLRGAQRPRARRSARGPGDPPMNVAFTVVAGVAGAVAGSRASGWLNVLLERLERLREEEDAERVEYEAEAATQAEAAQGARRAARAGPALAARALRLDLAGVGRGPGAGGGQLRPLRRPPGADLADLENLLWMAVFVHIVTFDLKHRLILDWVTYPAIVLAAGALGRHPGAVRWSGR